MKKAKYILACCSTVVFSLSAMGQTASDLLRFSQQNYSFGTARSAALGGAFTSLGADLSTMSINPAGLGMYRGTDFGISPQVSSMSVESNYLRQSNRNSNTKFVLGNIGAAFNLYQGEGGLTSFSLGVGYNRMADFNSDLLASGYQAPNSITEIFAEQLNNVSESDLQHPQGDPYKPFRSFPVSKWGGILGYQTGIMNPLASKTQYSPWDVLSRDATINPMQRIHTQGSIGEYTISGGFNIQNILYLGFSVGIQDVFYRENNSYFESYNNNPLSLQSMQYIQSKRMDGTGVNFKLGAIIRPVENLRIGIAVHTPTFISMNEEYIEYMAADYANNPSGDLLDSPYSLNDYNIQTPTRLLTGISYTIPGIGLITADYERVWYNGMRLTKMSGWQGPNQEALVKADVQNGFKASNNFRVGIEAIPVKNVFVRAGYANYGDCMRGDDIIFYNTANIRSYQSYSAGLGFRFNHVYADLSYIYTDYKYAPYDIFYFSDNQDTIESGSVIPKANRSTVIMTLGMKF